MESDEDIDATGASRATGVFDLWDGQPNMFLIEPDGIISALLGNEFDELGMAQLAKAKDAKEAVLFQQLFEGGRHAVSSIVDRLRVRLLVTTTKRRTRKR
jgi:hypothetical protein